MEPSLPSPGGQRMCCLLTLQLSVSQFPHLCNGIWNRIYLLGGWSVQEMGYTESTQHSVSLRAESDGLRVLTVLIMLILHYALHLLLPP